MAMLKYCDIEELLRNMFVFDKQMMLIIDCDKQGRSCKVVQ